MARFISGLMAGRRDAGRIMREDAHRWTYGHGVALMQAASWHRDLTRDVDDALASFDAAFAATFGGA